MFNDVSDWSPNCVALRLLLWWIAFQCTTTNNHLVSALLIPPRPVSFIRKNTNRLEAPFQTLIPLQATNENLVRIQRRTRTSLVELQALFSKQAETPLDGEYDLVIVGSGNGACGFLTRYLEQAAPDIKILILEQGNNFFFTGDLTHQNEWTKAYSESDIFKLHNAHTPQGTPILAGRACTMGGGGSINYTMIHESSRWLAQHLGHDEAYWDDLKKRLNERFHRDDPTTVATPITNHILEAGKSQSYAEPNRQHMIANIPSYSDGTQLPEDNPSTKQLYIFPTQFNEFGQRTNSGVSLVDWDDRRIHLKTQVTVSELIFEKPEHSGGSSSPARCVALTVQDQSDDQSTTWRASLTKGGRVVLCAGAASPRLLMPHRQALNNMAIGQGVNDHFAIPLGLYVPERDLKVSPKDIYGPVFATAVWKAKENGYPEGVDTVCGFDFFTGKLEQQLYMTSHLFMAFLPNAIKSVLLKQPFFFDLAKNVIRTLVSAINIIITLVTDGRIEFITAIIKYNPAIEGHYNDDGSNRITLRWFESEQDKDVAVKTISESLSLLETLGSKPHWLVQLIYRTVTKIPYKKDQVEEYVEHYRKNSLLSQQHMAGGCRFGHALDLGKTREDDDDLSRQKTGQVIGTSNLHVADLSTVPLPRVSPQMTAYLIGFHVAHQLSGG